MADSKISDLTSASALDGTEEVAIVQGGSTVKATVNNILNTNILYKARVYQLSTSAPVLVEYLNPLGFTITSARLGVGSYEFSGFTGELFADGGLYEVSLVTNGLPYDHKAWIAPNSNTEIGITSYSSGVPADSVLFEDYGGGTINVYHVITIYKY